MREGATDAEHSYHSQAAKANNGNQPLPTKDSTTPHGGHGTPPLPNIQRSTPTRSPPSHECAMPWTGPGTCAACQWRKTRKCAASLFCSSGWARPGFCFCTHPNSEYSRSLKANICPNAGNDWTKLFLPVFLNSNCACYNLGFACSLDPKRREPRVARNHKGK